MIHPPSTSPSARPTTSASNTTLNLKKANRWLKSLGKSSIVNNVRINLNVPTTTVHNTVVNQNDVIIYIVQKYYVAEQNLGIAVNKLEKVKNPRSPKFLHYADQVHKTQRQLLTTIYDLMVQLRSQSQSQFQFQPRDYLINLPIVESDELKNKFNESILFAAQALCKGYKVRNLNGNQTSSLLDLAIKLCACLDALRYKLRVLFFNLNNANHFAVTNLYPVLIEFDGAWSKFEKELCYSYFGIKDNFSLLQLQDSFLTTLNQTLYADKLIELDLIESLDPKLIICLPRLVFLDMLVAGDTNQIVNLFQIESNLNPLKNQIGTLNSNQLNDLKFILVNQRSLPSSNLTEAETNTDVNEIYTQICTLVDPVHSNNSNLILKLFQTTFSKFNSTN